MEKFILIRLQKSLLNTKVEQEKFEKQKLEWAKLVDEKTVTADGHHVELAANIGTPEDLEGVIE